MTDILSTTLEFRGNTYQVTIDGTATIIETRNTVPPPDQTLTRIGRTIFWENQRGERRVSMLTQKLTLIVGELEMRAREAVGS